MIFVKSIDWELLIWLINPENIGFNIVGIQNFGTAVGWFWQSAFGCTFNFGMFGL